jgi:hypothetical protein
MTADIHRVGLTGARFGHASRRPDADARVETDPGVETPPTSDEPARPLGARSVRAHHRRDAHPQAQPPEQPDVPPEQPDGAVVPPQRESRKGPVPPLPQPQRPPVPPLPQPQRSPVPPQRGPLGPSPLGAAPEPQIDERDAFPASSSPHGSAPEDRGEPEIDLDAFSAPTVRVRPYIHTGGRTRSTTPLPIESMVCTAPGASALRLNGAHRWVAELCSVPQSVAEVSARLGVPLAVARVVVDDLVEQRMVTVQRGVENKIPDPILMERVLAGLRRL